MKLASTFLRTPRLVSATRIIRPAVFTRPYSMETPLQSPLFTQQVVKAMRTL